MIIFALLGMTAACSDSKPYQCEWHHLTRVEKMATQLCGYSKYSWDHATAPIEKKSWVELSWLEQSALQLLGYEASAWDRGDRLRLQRAGSQHRSRKGNIMNQLKAFLPLSLAPWWPSKFSLSAFAVVVASVTLVGGVLNLLVHLRLVGCRGPLRTRDEK